ncbi:hypothetical protein GALMADRAFT_695900 [Galerina marginata CBS 339.88]|uniref:Uncharacterized protein n=1 Tax=Galerina marginata (strain CBS 339.88) TaxID=685588 RepID=A0A067TLP6_GALM3|nr:hypothetical protein GALMADRAFT_695900 [Galerina marginata CBS 339.88]
MALDANALVPTPSQHPHPHPNSNPSPHADGETPNPSLTLSPDDAYNNTSRGGARARINIKGHTPPPAYASLSPHPNTPSALPPASGPSSSSWPPTSSDQPYIPFSAPASTSSPALYPHPSSGFGPTPLTSGHPLLAVPHAYIGAPGAADRRARWRFVGSFMCALVLFVAVGAVLGLGLLGEWGGGPGGGRLGRQVV